MTASIQQMAPDNPIPVSRYSTTHLRPDRRYQAWLRRDWPRTRQIFRTEPHEPFDTSWESARLGPVMFVYTEITGMQWERRQEDIRASDFDPLVINMFDCGEAEGVNGGRVFRLHPGAYIFHDLGRPSLHRSTASRTHSIVVPRPIAEEAFGPLGNLHGRVVGGALANMLISHARQTRALLPMLDEPAADRLGRTFLEIAALAADALNRSPQPAPTSAALLRQRAEDEIERRLASNDTSVDALARMLGASRGQLFDAFRSEGGVHRYVMQQRLARACAALADRERAEPIGDIAHRLGFSDASHLSRLFRRHHGITPTTYRQLAARIGTGDERA